MWLDELKIAIVEKNIDKFGELMDNLPQLEKQEDIESALYLINEARSIVEGLRDDTLTSLLQIKKNIDFLKSTQSGASSKFDVMF